MAVAQGQYLRLEPEMEMRLSQLRESVWIRIGDLRLTMDDTDGALEAFSTVLKINPNNMLARKQVGAALAKKGRYLEAIQHLERIDLKKDDPTVRDMKVGDVWSLLAHCFVMTQQLNKAYDAYSRALSHVSDPKDPNLWYGIGLLYDRCGISENALEAFQAVLNIDPNFHRSEEVCFCIGIIYKEQGKLQESLAYFMRTITGGDPPHPLTYEDTLYQIAHVYELLNNYGKVVQIYDTALHHNPNHYRCLYQLGWIHHILGNQVEAIDLLTRATKSGMTDGQAFYLLGRVFMATEEFRRAYFAYQEAVHRDQHNSTYWCSIGVLYYQMQQHNDALDAYARAIRLNPGVSESWYDLGTLFESCGQAQDAIIAYRRAARIAPGSKAIMERLGKLESQEPASHPSVLQHPPAAGQDRTTISPAVIAGDIRSITRLPSITDLFREEILPAEEPRPASAQGGAVPVVQGVAQQPQLVASQRGAYPQEQWQAPQQSADGRPPAIHSTAGVPSYSSIQDRPSLVPPRPAIGGGVPTTYGRGATHLRHAAQYGAYGEGEEGRPDEQSRPGTALKHEGSIDEGRKDGGAAHMEPGRYPASVTQSGFGAPPRHAMEVRRPADMTASSGRPAFVDRSSVPKKEHEVPTAISGEASTTAETGMQVEMTSETPSAPPPPPERSRPIVSTADEDMAGEERAEESREASVGSPGDDAAAREVSAEMLPRLPSLPQEGPKPVEEPGFKKGGQSSQLASPQDEQIPSDAKQESRSEADAQKANTVITGERELRDEPVLHRSNEGIPGGVKVPEEDTQRETAALRSDIGGVLNNRADLSSKSVRQVVPGASNSGEGTAIATGVPGIRADGRRALEVDTAALQPNSQAVMRDDVVGSEEIPSRREKRKYPGGVAEKEKRKPPSSQRRESPEIERASDTKMSQYVETEDESVSGEEEEIRRPSRSAASKGNHAPLRSLPVPKDESPSRIEPSRPDADAREYTSAENSSAGHRRVAAEPALRDEANRASSSNELPPISTEQPKDDPKVSSPASPTAKDYSKQAPILANPLSKVPRPLPTNKLSAIRMGSLGIASPRTSRRSPNLSDSGSVDSPRRSRQRLPNLRSAPAPPWSPRLSASRSNTASEDAKKESREASPQVCGDKHSLDDQKAENGREVKKRRAGPSHLSPARQAEANSDIEADGSSRSKEEANVKDDSLENTSKTTSEHKTIKKFENTKRKSDEATGNKTFTDAEQGEDGKEVAVERDSVKEVA